MTDITADMPDNLKCTKCLSDLVVVTESTTYTPLKIVRGNKKTRRFMVEPILKPLASEKSNIKVVCPFCRHRYYQLEYGRVVNGAIEFENRYGSVNLDHLQMAQSYSQDEFMSIFAEKPVFQLIERPRE